MIYSGVLFMIQCAVSGSLKTQIRWSQRHGFADTTVRTGLDAGVENKGVRGFGSFSQKLTDGSTQTQYPE
jgi:hypothetical protein